MSEVIHQILPSVEDGRPFTVGCNQSIVSDYYQAQLKIIRGAIPASQWQGLRFTSEDGVAVAGWDYFIYMTTFGLFSEKAVDAFRTCLSHFFSVLPIALDDLAYYTLSCSRRLDVLDVENSKIDLFDADWVDPSNPKNEDIFCIEEYVFKNLEQIPSATIFAIPQRRDSLYCTDGVPEMALAANLKGFEFLPVFETKR